MSAVIDVDKVCPECLDRPCDGRINHTVWKMRDLKDTRCCNGCCPAIATWSEERAAIVDWLRYHARKRKLLGVALLADKLERGEHLDPASRLEPKPCRKCYGRGDVRREGGACRYCGSVAKAEPEDKGR